MRRGLSLAVMLGAAACGGGGGSGGGGGTVGTPGGSGVIVTGSLPLSASSFTAVSAGVTCQVGATTLGVAYAAIIASNGVDLCGDLQRNQVKANARSVELALAHVDPSSPTTSLVAGTYPVVTAPVAQGAYALARVTQTDASCSVGGVQATGGSVLLTSVANGELRGTIDATLSDGGKITGAFDAFTCAVTFPADVCTGSIGPANPSCAP